jgi:hypothetical protein
VINNTRTESRPIANVTENGYHVEGGLSDGLQPPPYSSPSAHHQPFSATAPPKRTVDEFEEDMEWPLTAEGEYKAEREAIDATTPRKAIKTELFTTPTKQRASGYVDHGLPTPDTGGSLLRRNIFAPTEETLGRQRKADSDFLDLVSPATMPTPTKFRDAEGAGLADKLFKDIVHALSENNDCLNTEAAAAVRKVCRQQDRKLEGAIQG